MSSPTLSVRVALASNPYDATPIWTEIGPASGLGPGSFQTNMLSADDASFEGGIGTWGTGYRSLVNCTIARSTAQALDGTHSLAVTNTGGDYSQIGTTYGMSCYPVSPNTQYTAVLSARAAVTGRPSQIIVQYFDASGAAVSWFNGAPTADTTTGWTQSTVTSTSPSTAAFAQILFYWSPSVAVGEVHYVDNVALNLGASTTWTPGGVTGGHGWVRGFTTKRGRERLLRSMSQFQAGTATVKLDNRDRRFDPTNTAGPYYPNVQPEKLIQVGATWGSTFYPIWTGHVDDWPQMWPGFQEAEVPVVATDLFKVLALARLMSTGYQKQILADGPVAYYRLGDPAGSTQAADSSGNGHNAAVEPLVTFGAPGAMPANVGSSASLAGGNPTSGQIIIPLTPLGSVLPGVTIECWVKTTGTWGEAIVQYGTSGLTINASGTVRIGTSGYALDSTKIVNDGLWHHVVAVLNYSTGFQLYIDGPLDTSWAVSPGGWPNPYVGTIGATAPYYFNHDTIDVQEVALYNQCLTGAQILKHYQLAAWPAQFTGQFVNQLLDTLGFPSTQRRIYQGYTLCQADVQSEVQNKVLDQMQKIEQTEQGQLFIGNDGYVNFQDRYHRYRSPNSNSVATFGDGAGSVLTPAELPGVLGGFSLGTYGGVGTPVVTPGEIPYAMGGVVLNFDRMELFNQVLVTRRNGTIQTASNQASIDAYTARTMQLSDLLMATEYDALYCGEWILSDTAYPQFRVGDLVLDPNTDDRLWPLVLGCEIGTVITVNKRNIPGGGPLISLLCRIEGIEHEVEPPKLWKTTWHVSLMGTGHWGIYNDPAMGLYNGLCRWGW